MHSHEPAILVITDDVELFADIGDALGESYQAEVRRASSAREAQRVTSERTFDLTIVDGRLADSDVLEFMREHTGAGQPTLLIEDRLVAERVLGALRIGVIDVLVRPVDWIRLDELVGITLSAGEQARRDQIRQKRLRSISSRVLRDRRELRQRIDLLCKDLVAAYRRLAEKVVANEERVAR
ncbi:MAG: hypothetical protein L6Q92_10550 [Phycisphaerae bacterium]|nr:hypothetical protein [Phycisphaerae bacterium]